MLLSTLTGISGYIQTFVMPVVFIGIVCKSVVTSCIMNQPQTYYTDYVPVYLQACKGASAIGSGVDVLSFSLILAPVGLLGGALVTRTGSYRPPLWIAWVVLMVGVGLLMRLDASSPLGHAIGFLVPSALGIGILAFSTYFPVLAPRESRLQPAIPGTVPADNVFQSMFRRTASRSRSSCFCAILPWYALVTYHAIGIAEYAFVGLGRHDRRHGAPERTAQASTSQFRSTVPSRH